MYDYLKMTETCDFEEQDARIINEHVRKEYARLNFEMDWSSTVKRFFCSSTYRVSFYICPDKGQGFDIGYIAFRRKDGKPINSWREKQMIKDIICGTETEAVEMYPSKIRLVDQCNQYHLWFLPKGYTWPFGLEYSGVIIDGKNQKKWEQRHLYDPEKLPGFGLLGEWWL